MSKRPITDAHVAKIERQRGYHWQYEDEWVDLARGLEDKLTAAQAEIATLKGYRDAWEWLECVLFDVEYRPFVCEWECDGSWAKTPIDAVKKAMAWHGEQEEGQ